MNPKGPDQIWSAMVSIGTEPGRVRPVLPLRTKRISSIKCPRSILSGHPRICAHLHSQSCKKVPSTSPPPPHVFKYQNMGTEKKPVCTVYLFSPSITAESIRESILFSVPIISISKCLQTSSMCVI